MEISEGKLFQIQIVKEKKDDLCMSLTITLKMYMV